MFPNAARLPQTQAAQTGGSEERGQASSQSTPHMMRRQNLRDRTSRGQARSG